MRRASGGWWVALAVVAMVLGVSWLTVEVRSGGGLLELDPTYSTWSSAPGGTRGLYVALEEAGVKPQRVGVDWTSLPDGLGVLVVPPPREPPAAEEWEAIDGWIRAGGRLVFAPPRPPWAAGPGADPPWRMVDVAGGGLLEGVERISVYREEVVREVPEEADPLLEGLVTLVHEEDRPVLAVARRGGGYLVVLDDPEILSNAGIMRNDNLRLAMNLLAGKGAVGFDEYHLGHATGHKGLWEVSPPAVRSGLVHLGVAMLLLVFALSRRVAGPRPDGAPARQRSEYLESMASLLRRAGATGLVLRLRRHAFDLALARALHLQPGSPLEERVAACEVLQPGLGRELEELEHAVKQFSTFRPSPEALLALAHRERQFLEKVRTLR